MNQHGLKGSCFWVDTSLIAGQRFSLIKPVLNSLIVNQHRSFLIKESYAVSIRNTIRKEKWINQQNSLAPQGNKEKVRKTPEAKPPLETELN